VKLDLSKLKRGDTVFVVAFDKRFSSDYDAVITKVGRKYFEVTPLREERLVDALTRKFDKVTGKHAWTHPHFRLTTRELYAIEQKHQQLVNNVRESLHSHIYQLENTTQEEIEAIWNAIPERFRRIAK